MSTFVSFGAAIALALLFGAVAYVLYAVAILIAMAAFGFTLGTDLMVALGVSWSAPMHEQWDSSARASAAAPG